MNPDHLNDKDYWKNQMEMMDGGLKAIIVTVFVIGIFMGVAISKLWQRWGG